MGYLSEDILQACFERREGVFASGEVANNKLDIEKIRVKPELKDRVVSSLGRIVLEYQPDFLIPVPDGANWLAFAIGNQHDIPFVRLKKARRLKTIQFFDSEAKQICRQSMRGVVIEDVFNKFTSTRAVLNMPMIDERAVAAVAVWDRGTLDERVPLSVERRALITRYIPAVLPEDDPLWEFVNE